MASAIASTSTALFPALAIAPSLLYRSPSPAPPPSLPSQTQQPTSIVLNDDDARLLGPKSGGRLKRFMCTWPGCGKTYTRPVRLEEHQHSHTGDRPFSCDHDGCDAAFRRKSHLDAHRRTHADDKEKEEKRLRCPEKGCDKRFWTNQHLKKHLELHKGAKTYDCEQCDLRFRKHKQLREHVAEAHSAPGTLPFPCTHEGCGRSFKQKVHLKAHEKTHDLSRYVCLHPSCLPLPLESRQFGNWTLLQRHTKTAHPPVCPHPECGGKTFTNRRNYRTHLQMHDEDERAGFVRAGTEGVEGGKRRRRGRGKKRGKGPGWVVKKEEEDVEETATETANETGAETGTASEALAVEVEVKPRRSKKRKAKTRSALVRVKKEDDDDAEYTPSATEDDSGSEWEEREEHARDARMREDFRYGGKKKRRVLAEADGFPSLSPLPVFPLPELPDPTLSSSDESRRAGPSRSSAFAPIASSSFLQPILPAPSTSSSAPTAVQSRMLDLLTGSNYAQPSGVPPSSLLSPSSAPGEPKKPRPLARQYACPFPAVLALPFNDLGPAKNLRVKAEPSSPSGPFIKSEPGEDDTDADADADGEGTCKFWFKRVYDVERHLKAAHGVEMKGGRAVLDEWFRSEREEEEE